MVLRRIVGITLICLAVAAGVLLALRRGEAASTRLMVHAGAGIRPALDELGTVFRRDTGIRVDYNYKGSACLLPDICVSKKGDAYIPGELYYMQQALDRKLVKSYRVVSGMSTVVIVQAGNPKKIKGMKDLAKPNLRIGLGDPQAVAIGRAAREALVKAGVWKKVEKNIVMSAQNVTELSNAIKLRQLDAAVVWDATAAMYNTKELVTITMPAKYRSVSPIPAGVLNFTKLPKDAQRYVDFLASDRAERIFKKHGFSPRPKAKVASKRAKN
jgi:molybdate transport system substrate-binding protein